MTTLLLQYYTVSKANVDSSKNMLLLRNSQFLPNHYETLSKLTTHEDLIWTKFRNEWVKNLNFLIKAYFWVSPVSPGTHCIMLVRFDFCSNNIRF